ncbi:MAG: hypothetical protein ACRD41_01005, partial [Candidatus Acidiferrales bacterium]
MNSISAHSSPERDQNKVRGMDEASHFLPRCFAALLLLLIPCFPANAQTPATSSISSKLNVAPDLAARVAKFKRVEMPYHSEGLSAREKQMVG